MRDKKSRGAAVFRRERIVIKSKRHPSLFVHEIGQWHISGVVTVRVHHGVLSIGFYIFEQGIEGNALPSRIEFRPSRDAVYISRNGFGGQAAKRLPIPSPQDLTAVAD